MKIDVERRGSGGWDSVLDTEEGPYHVVVPEVAYLRRFNRASRVGFTAA